MAIWMNRTDNRLFAVMHDMSVMANAPSGRIPDVTSSRAVCVQTLSDTQRSQQDPPLPVGSLQAQWSTVLAELSTSAHECVASIDDAGANETVTSVHTSSMSLHDFLIAQGAFSNLFRAIRHLDG